MSDALCRNSPMLLLLLHLLLLAVYLSGLLFVFSIGVTPATPHAQIKCKMQNHIDPRSRPHSAAVYGFLNDSNLLLWNRCHHKAQGRRGSFQAHIGFKSFLFIFFFNVVGLPTALRSIKAFCLMYSPPEPQRGGCKAEGKQSE